MLMDENMEKFTELLKELMALAKKKKNVLEYHEITDMFGTMLEDPEKMDKIFEFLEANNIDILRTSDTDDQDEEIILDDEDEVDVENIDLSIPEGISPTLASRKPVSSSSLYSFKGRTSSPRRRTMRSKISITNV